MIKTITQSLLEIIRLKSLISFKPLIVFFSFTTLFLILQFLVPGIIGFDGYYNLKTAALVAENGFVENFPWITNSILNDNYADIQPLFRLLHIPFIWLFGSLSGAKISSAIFSALVFAIFYFFLSKNKINYPFFWTILYFSASSFLMYRFLLARQMPLMISLMILTIYFLQRKKYWSLGIASILSVSIHSSFIFQVLIVIIFLFIDKIFTRKFDAKLLVYTFSGTLVGLALNPNFPQNILFLYTQIFEVNLVSNLYNSEWKPWSILEFLLNNFFILILLLISSFLLVRSRKITKDQALFLTLTLIFLVYTFVAKRMHEFLVPFTIMGASFLINDFLKGKNNLVKKNKIIFSFLILVILSINLYILKTSYLDQEFFHKFEGCSYWMQKNVPKDSVIFNNAYAFPYLFFKNDKLRYTHGIDLTYSYLYDKGKFLIYMDILQGKLNDIKTDYIIKDYNPDFVFSGKLRQDVQLFNYIVAHKENYEAAYEDDSCAVLKVNKHR
jgi:hypothetical protein